MAREGTRSQTGNARPRVFTTVDTEPTIARKSAPKTKTKKTTATAKPAGVTKKPAKKASPATKVRTLPEGFPGLALPEGEVLEKGSGGGEEC